MQGMFEGIVKYFCKEIQSLKIEFSALESALKK
jgi:hypothetical protein